MSRGVLNIQFEIRLVPKSPGGPFSPWSPLIPVFPWSPLSPLGIVKLNRAAVVVPTFTTLA